jgi:hypothetical protein
MNENKTKNSDACYMQCLISYLQMNVLSSLTYAGFGGLTFVDCLNVTMCILLRGEIKHIGSSRSASDLCSGGAWFGSRLVR